ncbi:MAG: acetoacetate--CoA ligase [Acidobacteria bacterium]|nr:acetoacetate--CoA ligase [Acidobacteriota bacterium]
MSEPLWEPSAERVAAARLTAFIEQVNRDFGLGVAGYQALYDWSISEIGDFWRAVWDFGEVIAETRGEVAIADGDKMPGARFFPDARLNFAENLLRNASAVGRQDASGGGRRNAAAGTVPMDDDDALVFWGEDAVRRRLSHDELYDRVARLSRALGAMGVGPGDRVAAFLPNMPEAIIGMLAAAALGATWSSCSPDFGVQGVVDRFGQIEPTVLICADGYRFKGKWIDSLDRVARFLSQLPSVKHVIVAGYCGERADVTALRSGLADAARGGGDDADRASVLSISALEDLYAEHAGGDIEFARMPFDHPLYILYSSGTTGKPKCIVHGAGGTLLKHIYEHQLMCDVRPGDRIFYFTTCGWMMWNWLASGLASGATLLLYDGNPVHPSPEVLFDLADAEDMTLFGTSAKFIDALDNLEVDVRSTHDLSSLRTLTSTGSPLAPEGFDFVYEHIKRDLCLSSISGGTDIVGCFVGGNPIGPVWRGEIQARGLGMAVDVFDDDGRSLGGEKGELVCTKPFPSMPVSFWNDPQGTRYRAAYFERYPGVWWHGDFAEITEHDGVIIYGRSDATLNPGGVRIGTAEIYRPVERLPQIEEGLVIGQEWHNDVRIVLFVRLSEGVALDDDLIARIKEEIRAGASPRHVPDVILQVADIPRTKSGKITELAVRDVVHGRPVKNRGALANPEALELFADRPELAAP